MKYVLKHRRFIQIAIGLLLLIAEKVFDPTVIRFWFDPTVVDAITDILWMLLAGSVTVEMVHDKNIATMQTELGVEPDKFVGDKTIDAAKSGGPNRG